ncbi:protein FAM78A [Phyllopteryx taeniolatus]|uniref:protein FAM78A n=1 Tax=Phyllopteryx taeniolatus TaxID=161469 RepID=UPI002AD2D354|nr:protein FAM78A [Phyllopteryx taeniolatus]
MRALPRLVLLWAVVEWLPDASAMGCLQSIACKPKSFRDGVAVLQVSASIDSKPTGIDESSAVILRYRTPHFRAQALVRVPPVAANETWTVGWIQACNHMEFYNTYGSKGMSSWEIPDLHNSSIQAISDSDGVNYPWYGNTTETYTIVGPTRSDSKFTVSMNDNFKPSITWGVPVSDSNVPELTGIRRDQSFTTWLVAINRATAEIVVLQTVRWRMRLSIRVDPEKPLGQRAVLLEPVAQEEPQILGENESIPPNAMVKPNANDAQMLMWRPQAGDPVVVIPPRY